MAHSSLTQSTYQSCGFYGKIIIKIQCFLEKEKMSLNQNHIKLRVAASLIAVLILSTYTQANTTDFEDLSLAPESYWNGFDGAGGFTSGAAQFNNYAVPDWNYWEGFAYSNRTDTNLSGLSGQYNAITGVGQDGSTNYALGFAGWTVVPTISFNQETIVKNLFVTNNNYTYHSMLLGDGYAKKFGGADGNDDDWFMLTITGKNAAGQTTGAIDFYLADFRFTDNAQDYIVNTWEKIDLTSLSMVQTLDFTLNSSDTGNFGMNTPGYFALDSLTVIPAPGAVVLAGFGISLIGLLRKRKYL